MKRFYGRRDKPVEFLQPGAQSSNETLSYRPVEKQLRRWINAYGTWPTEKNSYDGRMVGIARRGDFHPMPVRRVPPERVPTRRRDEYPLSGS